MKMYTLLAIAFTIFSSCAKDSTTQEDVNHNNTPNPTSPPFEIWMGQNTGSMGNWSNLRWMIVLPSGDYFNQLPTEGFLNFSINQTGGTWGTFTMNGNSGAFANQYQTLQVNKISATEMEIVGYTNHLYKLASVNGLWLSGQYVNGIPGWSTGSYPYGPNDAQPMIEFSNDGTFNDKGAFVLNYSMPYQHPERAPGNGTYEIRDFTLILNYSDGRTVTKAFTGLLNNQVTATSQLVFVGGNPFYNQ